MLQHLDNRICQCLFQFRAILTRLDNAIFIQVGDLTISKLDTRTLHLLRLAEANTRFFVNDPDKLWHTFHFLDTHSLPSIACSNSASSTVSLAERVPFTSCRARK